MREDLKEIVYDTNLQIEAYRFNGVAQAFPNHFHAYYVIGLIEVGERLLTVNNQDYRIEPGDLMTFNPRDNHACEQTDDGSLRYLCLNIKQEIMQATAQKILGCDTLPRFSQPVQSRTEIAPIFQALHRKIMASQQAIEKEESFLIFMQHLFVNYTSYDETQPDPIVRRELEEVCTYLEHHYAESITLDDLSCIAHLNKYSLIRAFTSHKGITPYRYLETIRIGRAKELLEQGTDQAQIAQLTGFSDQSHFSNQFSRFIGLTPGQYQAIFRKEAT